MRTFLAICLLFSNAYGQPNPNDVNSSASYINLYIKDTIIREFENTDLVISNGSSSTVLACYFHFPVIYLFIETDTDFVIVAEPIIIIYQKQYFWLLSGEYKINKVNNHTFIIAEIDTEL
jgi:hypothetical protein